MKIIKPKGNKAQKGPMNHEGVSIILSIVLIVLMLLGAFKLTERVYEEYKEFQITSFGHSDSYYRGDSFWNKRCLSKGFNSSEYREAEEKHYCIKYEEAYMGKWYA